MRTHRDKLRFGFLCIRHWALDVKRWEFSERLPTLAFETRSLPTLARCLPLQLMPVRLGPFYVARPSRSILLFNFLGSP
jgi:hypothetical protein